MTLVYPSEFKAKKRNSQSCRCRIVDRNAVFLSWPVKYDEMENMEESCAIFLVDYAADDPLRKLPCGHAFHKPVSAFPGSSVCSD